MTQSDPTFAPTGPHHPSIDPSHEDLLRETHRSLAVTFHSGASHELGSIRLERVGFASIPCLIVPISCKERDLAGFIPSLRQHAFGYLAERGVSDDHLRFVPGVSVGRRGRFRDQHGKSRMGEACEVRFELSHELAGMIKWSGRYGTLPSVWERS